jgi:hypothetical protein
MNPRCALRTMMHAVTEYHVGSPGFLAFTMSESLTSLPKAVALFNKATLSPQKIWSLNRKYLHLPDHMKTENYINLALTFTLRVTAITTYSLFQSVLFQRVLFCLIKCSLVWSILLFTLLLCFITFCSAIFCSFLLNSTSLHYLTFCYNYISLLYPLLLCFTLQCSLVYSVLLYSVLFSYNKLSSLSFCPVLFHSLSSYNCHLFMIVTNNNGFWIGWLDLLTPYTISSFIRTIQCYRWSAQFAVHRYTRTSILNLQ